MTDRDLLTRMLMGLASVVLLLFGWVATRELGRIGETTASTNTKILMLDDTLRSLALASADHARRLDLIERTRLDDCDDREARRARR